MKRISIFISALALSLISVGTIATPAFAAATNCSISIVGKNASDQFTVKNRVATVYVDVAGDKTCQRSATLVSWQGKIGGTTINDIKGQTLYQSNTQTFGRGVHAMSVNVPDCMFQVDLLKGKKATSPAGNADYGVAGSPTGTPTLLGWMQTGKHAKVCENPTPTPQPVTPVTPTTPPAATPTALPNTGPGNVVAIFMGTTILGTIVHKFGLRKLLLKI